MEKSEANDSIFRTTGLGKLPHTILKMAAEDQRGRSDSGWDSVDFYAKSAEHLFWFMFSNHILPFKI